MANKFVVCNLVFIFERLFMPPLPLRMILLTRLHILAVVEAAAEASEVAEAV
jgi:hypothetical protein